LSTGGDFHRLFLNGENKKEKLSFFFILFAALSACALQFFGDSAPFANRL
jgi:hypothetical protein